MRLEDLYAIITKRKKELPKGSYVASLYRQGEDVILQKIGEEATEVILAAKGNNNQRIIEEIADLYFMTLVLMISRNISLEGIYRELGKRRKQKDPEINSGNSG
jgi:phosphoribosyl-ATP pyrophosphohydrolase